MTPESVQPIVFIQWKEAALLITVMCTAVIVLSTVIYKTYQLGAKAFGAGVDLHVKPLIEGLQHEIRKGVDAISEVQQSHAKKIEDVADRVEYHGAELNRVGVKMDEHDDELGDHETRIAVLESQRVAPVTMPPVPAR